MTDTNTIAVVCANCSRKLKAGASLAGKTVKCPGCQSPIAIQGERPMPDHLPINSQKNRPTDAVRPAHNPRSRWTTVAVVLFLVGVVFIAGIAVARRVFAPESRMDAVDSTMVQPLTAVPVAAATVDIPPADAPAKPAEPPVPIPLRVAASAAPAALPKEKKSRKEPVDPFAGLVAMIVKSAKDNAEEEVSSYGYYVPPQALTEGKAIIVHELAVRFKVKAGTLWTLDKVKVMQVLTDTSFLATVPQWRIQTTDRNESDRILYFSGIDTSEMEEGTAVTLKPLLLCAGTYRYETTGGGSRQVPKFLQFPEAELPRLKMNVYSMLGKPLLIVDQVADQLPTKGQIKLLPDFRGEPEQQPLVDDAPMPETEGPAADKLLKDAQKLLKQKFRNKALAKFTEIVEKYPDSKAAEEAQKIIDQFTPMVIE